MAVQRGGPDAATGGGVTTGSGGVTTGSGGVTTGSGGVTTGSGGVTTGSGGVTTGSGGVTTGSGGVTTGSGGVTTGSGGATTGSGGATTGSGGATPITVDFIGTNSDIDAALPQAVGCDGGDGCTCSPFRLAVLGKPGKWGANPGGDPDTALQDWLNSRAAGTAQVDNFTSRQTLTADFLAGYDVIILASLSEDSSAGPWWTFTDAEAAAFRTWIENGGGVIALTGYSSGDETAPITRLVGFSGVVYDQTVWGACDDWSICNCTHSSTAKDWNRTDPIIADLSTGVKLVGFENGRTIAVPADGHVVATVNGNNVLAGKLVGKGRVLLFGDEWITYTSQWTGEGNPSANDPSCQGKLPQDAYQVAQFWYNMIRWAQPSANCFRIVDDGAPVPITIW